jgi:hypothetical protein
VATGAKHKQVTAAKNGLKRRHGIDELIFFIAEFVNVVDKGL